MVDAAERELAAVGVTDRPEVVLADAGYWHQDQMEAIVDRGIQVLIPPDAGERAGARTGWDGGLYAFMRRVLASDHGGGRQTPGHDRAGLRRHEVQPTSSASNAADAAPCAPKWRLISATQYLLKLWRHHSAPAPA